jgi:hypothetical protein
MKTDPNDVRRVTTTLPPPSLETRDRGGIFILYSPPGPPPPPYSLPRSKCETEGVKTITATTCPPPPGRVETPRKRRRRRTHPRYKRELVGRFSFFFQQSPLSLQTRIGGPFCFYFYHSNTPHLVAGCFIYYKIFRIDKIIKKYYSMTMKFQKKTLILVVIYYYNFCYKYIC